MARTGLSLVEGSLEYDAMYTVFGRVMLVVDPNGVPRRKRHLESKRAIHRVTHHPEGRPEPTVASEEALARAYATVLLLVREELRAYRASVGAAPPSLGQLMERDVLRLADAQAARLFREHAGALVFEEVTSTPGNSPRFDDVVQVQRDLLPGTRLASVDECRTLAAAVAGNRWYTTTVENLAGRFGVEVYVPASRARPQRRWCP